MEAFIILTGIGSALLPQYPDAGPIFTYFNASLYQQELNTYSSCMGARMLSQYAAKRPISNCLNYNAPRPSFACCDPHFTTLDGLSYSFNGLGISNYLISIRTKNSLLSFSKT